jgi:endonuclease I
MKIQVMIPCLLFALAAAAPQADAGIPPGYYDPAAGLSGEELQAALHGIIDDHDAISYDDVWSAFYTTDDKPNGKVWDMYSDIPGGTPPYEYTFGEDQGGSASGEGEGYNREHTWPLSWFDGGAPMNTDMFQIVPTDIYVNNRRSNYPYGEVSSPTWESLNGSRLGPCSWPGYSGTVFEPRDEYKGDLARGYFYMATRYYGEDGSWPGSPMTDGAQFLPWAEGMLVAWHLADPVGTKELDRNEAVYVIQDNRNPFIDHPEYVLMIWSPAGVGEDPAPMVASLAVSPNPFSSSTSISFELGESESVDLVLFDVCGRRTRTLLDDCRLGPGMHEVALAAIDDSGAPLASGVYFCRLTTPGGAYTCRVLLLR